MKEPLAGTGTLLALNLRRDRVLLPVWILSLAAMAAVSVRATIDLYGETAALRTAAQAINSSPAIIALYGPIADESSMGAVAVFKLVLLGGLFVALLTATVVRRHTRADEETGRAELLGGTSVGRHAALTAAVAEGLAAALLVGILTALGNTAAGVAASGSWAFGLAWAGIGGVGVALAAVTAQLASSARAAAGMTAAALGVAYLVRAIGDVSVGWLTWLSPFGWISLTHAYAGDRWLVLLLPVAFTAVGVALAFWLRSLRDLGSGLVAARPGRGAAPAWLASYPALVWRLGRSAFGWWMLGLLAIGALLGGVAPGVDQMLDSPQARAMMERLGGRGGLQDIFLAAEVSMMAAVVSAFAISGVGRSAAEESEGRAELTLSTPVSRGRAYWTAAAMVVGQAAALLVGFGIALATAFGAQERGVVAAGRAILPAALSQLAAVAVLIGLALMVWGWWPRRMFLAWAGLVAALVMGQLGELLYLPDAIIDLSPFGHLAKMPAEPFDGAAFAALAGVGALLAAAGWWGYRRRDLT